MSRRSEATDTRLTLIGNEWNIVVAQGKKAQEHGWPGKLAQTREDIIRWEVQFPNAFDTGINCTYAPTFDADVLDAEACDDIYQWIKDRFGDRGEIPRRTGLWPKFAVPLRTDMPFPGKTGRLKTRHFRAPNGAEYKLEFLGKGEMFVGYGIHEHTRKPYVWADDRGPRTLRPQQVAWIVEAEAAELMDAAAAILVKEHGYVEVFPTNGAGNGHTEPTDFRGPDGKLDVDACLAAMAPSGAGANETQPRVILALLQRGGHPEDVINHVLAATMAMSDRAKLGWDRAREAREVLRRCISEVRELNSEYDPSTGEIPIWLPGEAHADWIKAIERGKRPLFGYTDGMWRVTELATEEARPEEPKPESRLLVPLTVSEWLKRDLPPPDRLLGDWFTTTSRVLLSADTGLGKTSLVMAGSPMPPPASRSCTGRCTGQRACFSSTVRCRAGS